MTVGEAEAVIARARTELQNRLRRYEERRRAAPRVLPMSPTPPAPLTRRPHDLVPPNTAAADSGHATMLYHFALPNAHKTAEMTKAFRRRPLHSTR